MPDIFSGKFLPVLIAPALCVLGLILFAQDRFALYDFPLDDAWIHQVYAQSIAQGDGFSYNEGQPEAGSTSPLWSIITAPAQWLAPAGAHAAAVGIKFIGLLLALVILFSFTTIMQHMGARRSSACLAASILALDPRLLFSALSGMETLLLVALWMAGTLAMLEKKNLLAMSLFGLTAVSRPEAALLLPAAGLLLLVGDYKEHRRIRFGYLAGAAVLLAIPLIAWSAMCYSINGHPLPNTFYLKAESFSLAPRRLLSAFQGLSEHGLPATLIFWLGLGVAAAVVKRRRHPANSTVAVMLLLMPAIYLLAVSGSRDVLIEGYYWTRWLDPASLMLTAAACGGIAAAFQVLSAPAQAGGAALKSRRLMAGGLIMTALLSLWPFGESFMNRRSHISTDSRAIHTMNVQPGQWLAENTKPDAVIGVNDAGALKYFSKRPVVDLLGLNNKDAAFGRLSWDELLASCDWLVITPLYFQEGRGLDDLERHGFKPILQVTISKEEYTVCDCRSQRIKVIFKKETQP